MRALVCRAFGPLSDLAVETVDDPVPQPGEVVVRVDACGVNFLDALIVQGKYQVRPALPFSPGGEVAGTVLRVGDGVRRVAVGDAVLGSNVIGGFAEQAVFDQSRVVPIPADADRAAFAACSVAYGTALHGLEDRGALRAGETLLVLGAAGGVGIAAIQIGKMLGARVIAAASTDEKRATCLAQGADAAIDYTRADWRDALRAGAPGGIDVCFDAVGGPYAEIAIRSLAWRGRHLVVGFAHGEIPAPALNLVMLKGAASIGVFWGGLIQRQPAVAEAMLARLLDMIADGRLRPLIGATYTLDDSVGALHALLERRALGKLVVTPNAALAPAAPA